MILIRESEALHAKIDRLFATRRLAEQAEQMRVAGVSGVVFELSELQMSIYRLDQYFEQEWNLRAEDIASRWFSILRCLEQVLGTNSELEDLVRDIRGYQRVEEAIRISHRSPPSDLWELYRMKTCDVRLARTLISSRASSSMGRSEYLEVCLLFDLASEVCDDLEDLDEDSKTYNGNWFLLNVGTVGPHRAIAAYDSLGDSLSRCVDQWRRRLSSRDPAAAPLMWASQRLVRLRDLLSLARANMNGVTEIYAGSALAVARTETDYERRAGKELGQLGRLAHPEWSPA